jgi:hypothetical protein
MIPGERGVNDKDSGADLVDLRDFTGGRVHAFFQSRKHPLGVDHILHGGRP